MRQDIELTSFSKGEVSPRLKGRTDYKGYFDACETVLNMVVQPQGGLTRRPGTIYSDPVKDQANAPRLIGFQFKTTQAYMLEFTAGWIKVYRNRAPVTNVMTVTGAVDNGAGLIRLTVASTAGLYTGNPVTVASVGGVPNATGSWLLTVISGTTFDLQGSSFGGLYTAGGTATARVEIPTTYTASELAAIATTQSADQLFIWQPLHKPAILSRTSHTNWTIADAVFLDGPYLPTNTTTTTMTASAATGAITLTLSSIVGVNSDTGWATTDVGRQVRLLSGPTWGWAIITGWTSTTVVNATVQAIVTNGAAAAVGTTSVITWRLGKWSTTTGFPWLPSFWQQRLVSFGTNNQPNAIEASQTGDFFNMAPTKSDGSVIDTNALSWIISDDQVNAAVWISPAGSAQAMQLGLGTGGSEHILQAATTAQALTPTSVQAYRETTLGGKAYARALRIGKAVLFVNAAGEKIHQWQFDWQVNGYTAPDKTVESEHITHTGVVDMAYQKNPNGVIWFILNDGNLKGYTYLPEQGINGFHQHTLGGNYYGGHPVVEAIAVIPATDNKYDELWLAVKRTINGTVVRYIEVMDKYFDKIPQEQAIFMDSSLSSTLVYPAATLVASAISGSGVTFTASAGTPFVAGSVGSVIRWNDGVALITAYTSTTVVTGTWYANTPASDLEPQTSGNWSMTAPATSFSGLTHIPLETAQILGDGADFGTVTISAGGVATLPTGSASYATIGLPTSYQLVPMPFEPIRAAASSTQGRVKTIATLYLRLLETLGCNIGRKITDPMTGAISHPYEALETRSAADVLGQAPPLQTGIYRLKPKGSHDMEAQLEITGSGPYPITVLSMNATGDVGEMPGPG